jgi:A/G-specific adenine glycosylase
MLSKTWGLTHVRILPINYAGAVVGEVQARLLEWYAGQGRDLPWRHTRDPYAVLVAEVMLQQTQVDRVIPKWFAWLARFPTLRDLAGARRAEVIRAWQGMGYNLRALRLHAIACQAVAEFGGELPTTLDGLLRLHGVGRYTAGAVACFAYEQPVAVVDTNIRRVLGRVFLGQPLLDRGQERELQELADQILPRSAAYAWNQALMDLGATLCRAARPACLVCPLLQVCRAAPHMSTWPEQRRKQLQSQPRVDSGLQQRLDRGRIVDALRHGPVRLGQLRELFNGRHSWARVEQLVRRLIADGLVVIDDTQLVRLPD